MAAASLTLVSAGGDGSMKRSGEPSAVDIQVDDDIFVPDEVSVDIGDLVNWDWVGNSVHSATSGTPGNPDGIFDSGIQANGATFSYESDSAGTFDYYCRVHGALMTGILTVLPVIGVDEEFALIPALYGLTQNYPNPFNPNTTIRYGLPIASEVNLSIYNLLGEEVALLFNGNMPAGNHQVTWDASSMTSGIYFYRLQAGDFVQTRKMVLLK